MATLASLIVNISANTAKLTAGFSGAGSSATKFAGTLAKAGAAAGLAVAGVGVAAGKMAMDFQAEMANVGTLLGKEGSGRVKELGEDIKRLAQETGKPLSDLSGGLYQTISALGDSDDSMKILEIAAKGAAAGLADTNSVVDLLGATMKGYGTVNAEAAQKVSDLAFQTVKLGVTTMPELAATMGRVVPLASTLGVSMETLFGATATLTGVTGNTAEVTTQLRATMQALINPTDQMAALLTKTGFASGEAAIRSFGFQGTLDKLKEATGGNNQALAKAFGSVEALGAVLALTGAQSASFTEKTQAMTNANGASAEAFKIQQGSVKAMLDRLKQTLAVVMVNLGEQFLPMLNRMATWVQQHMPEIQAFFQKAFDIMGKGFTYIGQVVNWFITNVVTPLVERWRSSQGDIQGQFSATWESIKRIAGLIWGVISKYVELWTVIWREWGDEFMAIVRIAWNTNGAVIEAALKIIGGILDFFIGLFTGDWQRMADGFTAVFSGLWDGIKAIVGGAWDIIKIAFGGLWDSISAWFIDLISDASSWGSRMMSAFWDGITGWFGRIQSGLQGFSHSISPSFSGSGVELPMQGFARGGTVPGPIGMPQLAVVHGGEQILTQAQQRGGGGLTVNVVLQGPVYGVLDLDRRITQTVRDAIQGGAFRGVISTP